MPADQVAAFTRGALCHPAGVGLSDSMAPAPDTLPDWLTEADLDFYTAELERTGFEGGLNYYRCIDLDWELLAPYAGTPVSVPSLFLGGDRDIATAWAQEAIARLPETQADLRGSVILPNCGHWLQQEHPDRVNAALLEFLKGL